MSNIWTRVAVAAAVALALGLVGSTPALASHAWGGYHWARTSNAFTLTLGDTVTKSWDPYLATTSSDWSDSTVLDTTIVPGNGTSPRKCTPSTGRVEVCNTTYGFNGWLGVAGIWATGGHITKGYVKLNDSYYNTATYNTPAWRNLVMCQEVGHTLGLDHQDETFDNANLGTCMDYTNDPSANQQPNAHDYDQLALIYAHLDSSTTLAPTSSSGTGKARALPAASMAACDGEHGIPANAGPKDGDVFVCDRGEGELQITHVFWIPRGLPGAR